MGMRDVLLDMRAFGFAAFLCFFSLMESPYGDAGTPSSLFFPTSYALGFVICGFIACRGVALSFRAKVLASLLAGLAGLGLVALSGVLGSSGTVALCSSLPLGASLCLNAAVWCESLINDTNEKTFSVIVAGSLYSALARLVAQPLGNLIGNGVLACLFLVGSAVAASHCAPSPCGTETPAITTSEESARRETRQKARQKSDALRDSATALRSIALPLAYTGLFQLAFSVLRGTSQNALERAYWGSPFAVVGFFLASLLLLAMSKTRRTKAPLNLDTLFAVLAMTTIAAFLTATLTNGVVFTFAVVLMDVPYAIASIMLYSACFDTARRAGLPTSIIGFSFAAMYAIVGVGHAIGYTTIRTFGQSTQGLLVAAICVLLAFFSFSTLLGILGSKTREASQENGSETGTAEAGTNRIGKKSTLVSFSENELRGSTILVEQYGLTEREFDVLLLLACGRTLREIADSLVVSENTVRTHVKKIYAKLGVHSRGECLDLLGEITACATRTDETQRGRAGAGYTNRA